MKLINYIGMPTIMINWNASENVENLTFLQTLDQSGWLESQTFVSPRR